MQKETRGLKEKTAKWAKLSLVFGSKFTKQSQNIWSILKTKFVFQANCD